MSTLSIFVGCLTLAVCQLQDITGNINHCEESCCNKKNIVLQYDNQMLNRMHEHCKQHVINEQVKIEVYQHELINKEKEIHELQEQANDTASRTARLRLEIQDKNVRIGQLERQLVEARCTDDYTYVAELALCYKLVKVSEPRDDAESQCNQNGATLLKVDSNGKFQYFVDQLTNHYPELDSTKGTSGFGLWIDGKYNNGRWEDGTGAEMENIFWDPNAPVEPYSDSCTYFSYSTNGPWISNRECTKTFYFICQVEP